MLRPKYKVTVERSEKNSIYQFIGWNPFVSPEDLELDWECLMEAIHKIEQNGNFVTITAQSCEIGNGIDIYMADTKIEAVLKAVLGFITSYNKKHNIRSFY